MWRMDANGQRPQELPQSFSNHDREQWKVLWQFRKPRSRTWIRSSCVPSGRKRGPFLGKVYCTSRPKCRTLLLQPPVRTFSSAMAYYNEHEMMFSAEEHRVMIRSLVATALSGIAGIIIYSAGSIGLLPFLFAGLLLCSQPVAAQASCDWRNQAQCSPVIGCTWTGAACVEAGRPGFVQVPHHAAECSWRWLCYRPLAGRCHCILVQSQHLVACFAPVYWYLLPASCCYCWANFGCCCELGGQALAEPVEQVALTLGRAVTTRKSKLGTELVVSPWTDNSCMAECQDVTESCWWMECIQFHPEQTQAGWLSATKQQKALSPLQHMVWCALCTSPSCWVSWMKICAHWLADCFALRWLAEVLPDISKGCRGRVADVLFGTWQWCFLHWQRVFGQWNCLVDSLVCIVIV